MNLYIRPDFSKTVRATTLLKLIILCIFAFSATLTPVLAQSSIAPTTQISLSGSQGLASWYVSPVQVTLTAADPDGDLLSTSYSVDGNTVQAYSGPFTISGDGTHTIVFGSVDKAGNSETVQTRTIKIDTASPLTTLSISGTQSASGAYRRFSVFTLSGVDAISGLAATYYILDSGATQIYTKPLSLDGSGAHTIVYWSVDAAGNAETRHTFSFKIYIPASVTVALTSSLNPATRFQAVTFQANIVPTATTTLAPTGTVVFKDGSTTLATVAVSNGKATYTTDSLVTGSHSLTTEYSGDLIFNAGTSAKLTQTITGMPTATTLALSPTSSTLGQPVTCTATVAPTAGGANLPTGTVTFSANGTTVGTATLSGATATFTTSTLPAGASTLTAAYAGDNNFGASVSTAQQETVTASLFTVLTITGMQSASGAYRRFSVLTLTCTGSLAAGATTYYIMDGGATQVYTKPLSLDGSGSHTIVYWSVDQFGSAEPRHTFNFKIYIPASVTVTLTSSLNPATRFQAVTFQATITSTVATTVVPTGTVVFKDGSTTLATVAVTGGQAAYTTDAVPIGSHSITAIYSGDVVFNPATSATLTQNITGMPTATTLVVSPTASTLGQLVTCTATVTPTASSATLPTGTVTFSANGTTLGTSMLSGGTATFTHSALASGTNSITATYSGDTNFLSSTSAPALQTVLALAPTTTTLVLSPLSSTYGQAVTCTATVAGGTTLPSGTVTFSANDVTLGTATLAGGIATFTTSTLPIGINTITATYSGDASFLSSTSAPATETVSAPLTPTTTALVLSPTSSTFGQTVTCTATIAPTDSSANLPTGTVTFSTNGTTLNTVTVSGGTATFTTSTLPIGTNIITATYSGDTNFLSSTSAPATETVLALPTPTTTALVLSPLSSTFGQTVTCTATVTPTVTGTTLPTGTIIFSDMGTTLGTTTLSGGTSVFTTSALSPGSHQITATYSGATNFLSSASATATETVSGTLLTTLSIAGMQSGSGAYRRFSLLTLTCTGSLAAGATTYYTMDGGATQVYTKPLSLDGSGSHTIVYWSVDQFGSAEPRHTFSFKIYIPTSVTVTLTSSLNPATRFQAITFQATITSTVTTTVVPTGTVVFKDGSTTLATVAVSNGKATYTTDALVTGSHSLTTEYSGDVVFNAGTSAKLTQTITGIPTATTLVLSPTASTLGQLVTCTATVAPTAGGANLPTGTVTFSANGTTLGTATLSAGAATFTTNDLPLGTITLTAIYAGDTNFGASVSTAQQETVTTTGPWTTLTIDGLRSTSGAYRRFSVFMLSCTDPSTSVFTTYYTLDGGDVQIYTKPFSLDLSGNHTLVYWSVDEFGSTEPHHTFAFKMYYPAPVTIVLNSSLNPAARNQTITFTAQVAPVTASATALTGTMAFKDGYVTLATVPVSAGQANFTTDLTAGTHKITAVYSGDVIYSGITSTPVSQVITGYPTTTTLALSVSTIGFGRPLSCTATVTAISPDGTVPGGTVTFLSDSRVLGTAPMINGQAQFDATFVPIGVDNLYAVYSGDGNCATSTSASVVETVTGVKIMPMGDSITWGYSADPLVVGGYRGPLWQMTTAQGWNCQFVGMINYGPAYIGGCEGRVGYSTNMMEADLPMIVAANTPDIILLQIGSNDFNRWDETYYVAVAQMNSLLDKLLLAYPNVQLYVASPTWQPNDWYRERFIAYNAALPGMVSTRAAKGYHIYFVDMYTLSNLSIADMSVGSHPTADGYQKMANVWYNVLNALPIPGK